MYIFIGLRPNATHSVAFSFTPVAWNLDVMSGSASS